jgi:hypothetical protein
MDISRGLDAYAHRQADVYWSLAVSFVTLWSPELRKSNITVDWPPEVAEHAATVDAPPERKAGRRKAKAAYMSDSDESEDGTLESIRFRGARLESDAESLVGGGDSIGSDGDGESILQYLAGYTDNENSDDAL